MNDMFEFATPEKAGISSENVLRFFKKLEEHGIFMHSAVMARGDRIFCEAYWRPYGADSLQRMYSVTKSFVGIAICELVSEGRLSLDDKIISFFPDKLPKTVHPYLAAQTIRHMLTMQTCMTYCNWFGQNVTDRVYHYFHITPSHQPGTGYYYDSEGSFILCALVERLTGKSLLDYLREKCLDEIGFSKEAFCLKAPGGHTWGDSALLCTARDLLAFGRLVANGGKWCGRQLLDAKMTADAVKKHSDTGEFFGSNAHSSLGYGYQIWRCFDGSFAFYGMHGQIMVYHPKTDIIAVFTSGNPHSDARSVILGCFFGYIIYNVSDGELSASSVYPELKEHCEELKLITARGDARSDFETEINGKTFVADDNNMRISTFSLTFDDEGGLFTYCNRQGEKALRFGRLKNVFQQFPETGYSKHVGGVKCDGHTYRCAVSAAWVEERKLSVIVQITDDYLGLLRITVGFCDGCAFLNMQKDAEDFLCEYDGSAAAKMADAR